jgi:hypothetical protein
MISALQRVLKFTKQDMLKMMAPSLGSAILTFPPENNIDTLRNDARKLAQATVWP